METLLENKQGIPPVKDSNPRSPPRLSTICTIPRNTD